MKLLLRYNSGIGALMCDCGAIMAEGYEHCGKYTCRQEDCNRTYEIVNKIPGGYEAIEIE